MRKIMAILFVVCAFALTGIAQNEPASTQNSQMPAQNQPAPDQMSSPAQSTTTTTTTTETTPALPASDQTAMGQNATADQSATAQTLIQHERDSWVSAKEKNAKYFANGLPANVTATTPNGATEDKPTIETMVRKYGISDYNLSNFNVTFPSSDRAQITYNASFTGKKAGHETRQVVSEWQMGPDGTWQNVRVDFK
jgi:hypothetical protein